MPKAKSASFVTTPNDNMGYNDNLNSFQEQPASSALQVGSAATSFTNNQYLLPTSVGMYIVPQPSTSAVQSGNQQQQFYIVNQPVCIPQQTPVMQFLQPLAPANNPVVIHPNQNSPLIKDNVHLSEQDIMTMPTIIINECNEITHAGEYEKFKEDDDFFSTSVYEIFQIMILFKTVDLDKIKHKLQQ